MKYEIGIPVLAPFTFIAGMIIGISNVAPLTVGILLIISIIAAIIFDPHIKRAAHWKFEGVFEEIGFVGGYILGLMI